MTDQDLLSEIQYALLEPANGGQDWPSEVWTRDDGINAVNEAERNLFRQTHLIVTRIELVVLAGATSVTLPSDWLATCHIVWRGVDSIRTPLAPVDLTEADLGRPTWETVPDRPQGYRDTSAESLTIQLVPTPDATGVIELLYIAVPLEVNGNGRSLTVPDECVSAVKYGALGSLLGGVGRLQDPERAAYCEARADMVKTAVDILLGGWA